MTTTPTGGAADLPEALRIAAALEYCDANVAREAINELRRLHALTAQAPSQPGGFDAGDMASAAAQGFRDGLAAAQADSAEPAVHVQNPAENEHVAGDVSKNGAESNMSTQPVAQQGAAYAALPESLMLAVDRWFANNTGLGGCSGKDVRELAELFYDVTHEGGRESVDDALAIVESFGPGIGGLNDTYARQVLLAAEVTRLRGIYKSAVAGRASMRDALRASHGQAPAQPDALPFGYFHQLLNHEGEGNGVWLGTAEREVVEQSHTPGETGEEIVALYAAATPTPQAADTGAAQPNPWLSALQIRMAQGWKLKGDRVPVLYTDTINGDGVGRDDLWLCTTEALAHVPAQGAGITEEECNKAALELEVADLAAPQPAPPADSQKAPVRKIEDCPELNMSNYDDVDVGSLSDWATRASDEIDRLSAARAQADSVTAPAGGVNPWVGRSV